jgi:antitoxin ParD1/3/4
MTEIKVCLDPKMTEFIDRLVAGGRYDTVDEIFTDSLQLLRDWEDLRRIHIEELRREIAIGIEQLDHGESAPIGVSCWHRS